MFAIVAAVVVAWVLVAVAVAFGLGRAIGLADRRRRRMIADPLRIVEEAAPRRLRAHR